MKGCPVLLRSISLVGLGLLSAVACAGLLPALAASGAPRIAFPLARGPLAWGQVPPVVRVAEVSAAKCREELEVLAGLMKEGDRARLAIETLGRVAQCEAVKAAVRALGAARSPDRDGVEVRRNETARDKSGSSEAEPARSAAGSDARDRRGADAKPDGQVPASIDKDEADRRKAGEEAERRKLAEDAERRKAEEAARRREAAEARRVREAARKKAEIDKVEVKRKPAADKASSSGIVTQARCASMVRAKYGYIYAAVDWQMRISMCMSTGGTNY